MYNPVMQHQLDDINKKDLYVLYYALYKRVLSLRSTDLGPGVGRDLTKRLLSFMDDTDKDNCVVDGQGLPLGELRLLSGVGSYPIPYLRDTELESPLTNSGYKKLLKGEIPKGGK